jgi:hypothetical protein
MFEFSLSCFWIYWVYAMVLDNRFPFALPLSPFSSVSREVVSASKLFVAVWSLDL